MIAHNRSQTIKPISNQSNQETQKAVKAKQSINNERNRSDLKINTTYGETEEHRDSNQPGSSVKKEEKTYQHTFLCSKTWLQWVKEREEKKEKQSLMRSEGRGVGEEGFYNEQAAKERGFPDHRFYRLISTPLASNLSRLSLQVNFSFFALSPHTCFLDLSFTLLLLLLFYIFGPGAFHAFLFTFRLYRCVIHYNSSIWVPACHVIIKFTINWW